MENKSNDVLNFINDQHRELIKSDEFMKKICIHCGEWDMRECKSRPKSLFIFGDNDIKKGLGGQAIIRKCKNTIGIPTKKRPTNGPSAFYTDDEISETQKKIQAAIVEILNVSINYNEIVFPEKGFGTGLAKLNEKAPLTYKYLNAVINECFEIDFEYIQKNGLLASFDSNTNKKLDEIEIMQKNNIEKLQTNE